MAFVFCFLGPYLWHKEVPRLGAISEIQLLVIATARAMWALICICDLQPQLMATLDPQPTEQCQGSNLQPHEY